MNYYKINNSPMGANKQKILQDLNDVDEFSIVLPDEDGVTLLIDTDKQTDYKVVFEEGSANTPVILKYEQGAERPITIMFVNNSSENIQILLNSDDNTPATTIPANETRLLNLHISAGEFINTYSLYDIAPSGGGTIVEKEERWFNKEEVFIDVGGDSFEGNADFTFATLEEFEEFCRGTKIVFHTDEDYPSVVIALTYDLLINKTFKIGEGMIPVPESIQYSSMGSGETSAALPIWTGIYITDISDNTIPVEIPFSNMLVDKYSSELTVALFNIEYLPQYSNCIIGITTSPMDGGHPEPIKFSEPFVSLDLCAKLNNKVPVVNIDLWNCYFPNLIINNTYADTLNIVAEGEFELKFYENPIGQLHGWMTIVNTPNKVSFLLDGEFIVNFSYPNPSEIAMEDKIVFIYIDGEGDFNMTTPHRVMHFLGDFTSDTEIEEAIEVIAVLATPGWGHLLLDIYDEDSNVHLNTEDTYKLNLWDDEDFVIKQLGDNGNTDEENYTFQLHLNWIGDPDEAPEEEFGVPVDNLNILTVNGSYISTGRGLTLETP